MFIPLTVSDHVRQATVPAAGGIPGHDQPGHRRADRRSAEKLPGQGLDAAPHTIAWYPEHHHHVRISAAPVSRYLARQEAGYAGPGQAAQILLPAVRSGHAERVLTV
jgi:hypothetical protein